MKSYARYAADLPTPRLRGQITAWAERAAFRALERDECLEDGAVATTAAFDN